MSLYMRAVIRDWSTPGFDALAAHVSDRTPFRVIDVEGKGWAEFEVQRGDTTVLAADLLAHDNAREELDELVGFLSDVDGSDAARNAVLRHLTKADAIVGMQILMSTYDDSVAAANAIIDFLEQAPDVLTQVDTVGWYDGNDLILREPE